MIEQKIELTLQEISGMRQSIVEFNKIDLPIDVAYKFGKIVKAVNEELESIEEQRVKLVKKYTTEETVPVLDAEGKDTKKTEKKDMVNKENEVLFYKDFNKFLKEETISLKVKPIKTSALRDTKVKSNIMASITPFFVSEDE